MERRDHGKRHTPPPRQTWGVCVEWAREGDRQKRQRQTDGGGESVSKRRGAARDRQTEESDGAVGAQRKTEGAKEGPGPSGTSRSLQEGGRC